MSKFITVTDATTDPKDFVGIELEQTGTDGEIVAAVFVTNEVNGFGWPVGCQISGPLKKLADGKYGAA